MVPFSLRLTFGTGSGSVADVQCLPELPEEGGVHPLLEYPSVDPRGPGAQPCSLEDVVHGKFRSPVHRLEQVVAFDSRCRSGFVALFPRQPVWRFYSGHLVDHRPSTSTAPYLVFKPTPHVDLSFGELGDDGNVRSAPFVMGHQVVPNRLDRPSQPSLHLYLKTTHRSHLPSRARCVPGSAPRLLR